jgi:L-lactate dehydrogenase
MDIRQGTPFCEPVSIWAGDYEDAKDSDIVIITSGMARKPGQSRLDLTRVNVDIIKSITPEITKHAPNAVYVIVSNPVDILTYVFTKISGIPENRIIGSGTILDTARVRSRLAEHFNLSQKSVHAYVFGEHGDSSFIPWSLATIASMPLEDYEKGISREALEKFGPLEYENIETYTKKSGADIIANKGATFYAVAISVCHICKKLLGSTDAIITVSSMMHGEFGIDDVCLSYLTIVGNGGIKGRVAPPLLPEEEEKFRKSAECLKNIIAELEI